MAIHLPLAGTDLREKMGCTYHLVDILNPLLVGKLEVLSIESVRNFVKTNWIDGIMAHYSVWLDPNDHETPVFVELTKTEDNFIRVKILWDFKTGEELADGIEISLD